MMLEPIDCQIAFYMYLARHVIVKVTSALELAITFQKSFYSSLSAVCS